jgi:hypothetical protein
MAINIPILTSFVDKGVSAAEKAFGGLSKSTLIAGAAIAGAATAVGIFAYKSIQKASDFNEAISKNAVVFGAISKEVENFAQTSSRALGISETAALQAAGTFAIFGKSAGLAGKELSDFSTQFVTLAADIASFSNTKVEDAITAIGSALRGEAEPLRKYGVLLNDAVLKNAAIELGIYSGNKALTAQQKVLAAQKVIFEQTSDAQGDFSRTSSGLAAQQKILSATLENIQTNLGQAFLPIFLKAVKFFNDEVTPAFERVAEVIGEKGLVKGMQQALFEMGTFGPGMVNAFKQIAVTAAKAANVLYRFAVVTAATALFAMGQATAGVKMLGKAFDTLIDVDKLGASFDNFSAGIKNMGRMSDYSSFAAKKLAEDAQAAAEAVEDLPPPGADDKLKKLQKAIKDASTALEKDMVKALGNAKDALGDAQTAFDDFATTVSDGVRDAFSFADAKAGGDETGKGFLAGLQDQVAGIQVYAGDVSELLTMGLSEDSLRAVLDAGGESGAAIAKELIAGGVNAILKTNQLVESSRVAAAIIGQQSAKQWYGAGVSNAQSYLQGVEAAFAEAQKRLAKKGLKIADIKGISASFSEALSGPSVTPISMRPDAGSGAPGTGVVINVSGVLSNAQTGQAVLDSLTQYTQIYGPLNLAVR